MAGTELRVNSESRAVDRLPFASESGLQRFVKEHSEDLLGLKVVAVAERGGGMISKIDILGVDRSGHLWIIECKHDLVNHRAVDQLLRYRSAVLKRWARIQKILAARLGSTRLQNHAQPRLLTIGYCYDRSLAAVKDLTRLAYRYHGIEFTQDKFQRRRAGQVNLYRVDSIEWPTQRHPRVLKKAGTLRRLDVLKPSVKAAFYDIDAKLSRLAGVEVTCDKNLVRYRTATGVFATAAILRDAVEWRLRGGGKIPLRVAADAPEAMKALRSAHTERANKALHRTAAGAIVSGRR